MGSYLTVTVDMSKSPATINPDADRTPVAKDIWCYSTKEKAFTWHVVVNHDKHGYVDRVQCKITGTIHKYKKQNKTATTTTVRKTPARKSTSKKAPVIDLEELWYKSVREWSDNEVIPYSQDKPLKNGDVFNHPTFGKGVVQGRRDNKIDVVFKAGPKTLLNAKE